MTDKTQIYIQKVINVYLTLSCGLMTGLYGKPDSGTELR